MVSVTEPEHAAARIATLAARGAAGAMIPLYPHTDRRYDNPSYGPLWKALSEHGVPAIFHRGATRDVLTDPMPFDLALSHVGEDDPLFGDLLDVLGDVGEGHLLWASSHVVGSKVERASGEAFGTDATRAVHFSRGAA
jgi:hypothetical protein